MQLYWILFSYLSGSIPTGKIIGNAIYKKDIQKHGSGNIGFANAWRVLGKKAALSVLAVDMVKGWLPVFLFYRHTAPLSLMGFAIIIAPVAGHIFPVWLKFKGGKGVATALGTAIALNPILGIISCATWLISIYLSRKTWLSSAISISTIPTLFLFRGEKEFAVVYGIVGVIIAFKHYTGTKTT